MSDQAEPEVWTFATFPEGRSLGVHAIVLDPAFVELWTRVYPHDTPVGDTLPAGASTVVLMKAWRSIVDPRPPGNVHAGQQVRIQALPRLGERIETEVRCVSKEERKGRRFVLLATTSRGERGRRLFTAHVTLVWAR